MLAAHICRLYKVEVKSPLLPQRVEEQHRLLLLYLSRDVLDPGLRI